MPDLSKRILMNFRRLHSVAFFSFSILFGPSLWLDQTRATEESSLPSKQNLQSDASTRFYSSQKKISLDCRDFLKASARRPLRHSKPMDIISADKKSGYLEPNLIKPTPTPLLDSIIQAEAWAFKSFAPPLTFHASQTHSWMDTLRQCRIAAVGITDYENITNLCRSIIWLHLVDDLKEAGKISIEDFLSEFKTAFTSGEEFQGLDFEFFDPSLLTVKILAQSLFEIHQSFPKDNLQVRKKLFFFGLEKMLNGERLFQSNSVARFQHQIELSAKFSEENPSDQKVKQLISKLDPLYVAFTVNSLFESIEIFRENLPEFYLIQLENLIYGPIVNYHDLDEEVKKEGRSEETLPTFKLVRDSYIEILSVSSGLSLSDQQLIWQRFPWILEAFVNVFPKNLKLFFIVLLNKLHDQALIPDWSEEEIRKLQKKLLK